MGVAEVFVVLAVDVVDDVVVVVGDVVVVEVDQQTESVLC
jgi:hypothetical protein